MFNSPKFKRAIYGHLVIFLIGLIGVLFALYQGLSLLSMIQAHTSQPVLVNMERKESITDLYLFMYTGDMQRYEKAERSINNIIQYREALSKYLFQQENPLSNEELNHITKYNPQINRTASVVTLYVGLYFSDQMAIGNWDLNTANMRKYLELARNIKQASLEGNLNEATIASYDQQIQWLDQDYTARVVTLVQNLYEANYRIRFFTFTIIAFLALSLLLYASYISRVRLRHVRQLQLYADQNRRYRTFPETNPYPVLAFGPENVLTYFNAAAEKVFPDLNVLKNDHPFIRQVRQAFRNDIKDGQEIVYQHMEFRGTHYDVMIRTTIDQNGFHAYIFDSSVVYEQKNKIEENLREKEILIREIHHRVNNNLAIILGFLELSEQKMNDDLCRRLNDLNMTRIRTVSIINRALYEHGDFTNVDFASHLVYLQNTNKLKVSFDSSDCIILNVNQAFSLALLLNEIIQEMRSIACCKDACLAVTRKKDAIRISISSPDVENFTIPDNEIMQLMVAQLGVERFGYDRDHHTFSFEFEVREVSGAMATTHLSNGLS
jgi:signal transduction histidine kinase